MVESSLNPVVSRGWLLALLADVARAHLNPLERKVIQIDVDVVSANADYRLVKDWVSASA